MKKEAVVISIQAYSKVYFIIVRSKTGQHIIIVSYTQIPDQNLAMGQIIICS
jgi:alpha-D-ribose 1-methylphosphonate 5-phosphate C-P lyase